MRWHHIAPAASLLVIAAPAAAHILPFHGTDLTDGFAHPFLGIDHFLAMVAVGLWAGILGGSAIVLLPLAFPALMVVGELVALAGFPLPFVEPAIAASVLVLGLAVTLAWRPAMRWGLLAVALFGLFHGYAHGAEWPNGDVPIRYAIGFVAATFLLHAFGIALGVFAGRFGQPFLARLAGVGVALSGLVLAAMSAFE